MSHPSLPMHRGVHPCVLSPIDNPRPASISCGTWPCIFQPFQITFAKPPQSHLHTGDSQNASSRFLGRYEPVDQFNRVATGRQCDQRRKANGSSWKQRTGSEMNRATTTESWQIRCHTMPRSTQIRSARLSAKHWNIEANQAARNCRKERTSLDEELVRILASRRSDWNVLLIAKPIRLPTFLISTART